MRDGEQVELIDGVHLRALDGSGLVITGERAVWTPMTIFWCCKGLQKPKIQCSG